MVLWSEEEDRLLDDGQPPLRLESIDLLYSNTVLDQPFVDSFCRMRHIYFSSEVGFSKDVGKS